MTVPLRRIMELFRFFLVFITCTLVCYGILTFFSEHLLPANPYREPRGNAIKVLKLLDGHFKEEWEWYYDRLQLYYFTGE